MKNSRLFPICLAFAISIQLAGAADARTKKRSTARTAASRGRSVGRHQIIFFPNVRDETSGIAAEHGWVQRQYPSYEWKNCELLEDALGRTYHRVLLIDRRGREITVYFDVSNWYPA